MKSKNDVKTIFIFIAFVAILINFIGIKLSTNANHKSDDSLVDNERCNVKTSSYWILNPFVIDDSGGGGNGTWAWAVAQPWCSGSGTFSDPYVIENITINGNRLSNGISIENSNAYFVINNCTVYNATLGVKLLNTNQGLLINNTCYNNSRAGIYLESSDNNTIEKNNASFNGLKSLTYGNINYSDGIFLNQSHSNTLKRNNASFNIAQRESSGIYLKNSHDNLILNNTSDENKAIRIAGGITLLSCTNNTISNNSISNNHLQGIFLYYSYDNNKLTKNLMQGNGIVDMGGFFMPNIIDTSNLVNGKPVYYYVDKNDLNNSNFTNAGQVILINCNNSIVSNLNVSYGSIGIWLWGCFNNKIFNNNASFHKDKGIVVISSKNNTVLTNFLRNNSQHGIFFYDGTNNTALNNTIIKNSVGIDISEDFDKIIANNISNNDEYGITIEADNTTATNNCITFNKVSGIFISGGSKNNTIFNNSIKNNKKTGITMETYSNGNIIYNNIFIDNNLNALDNGTNNRWDNDSLGNYWHDYSGVDANDDGIGDSPYNVSGTAGSQDQYPIWDDGDSIAPVITINSPLMNDLYGKKAPNFNISILELNLNATWYSLYNGSQWLINITFKGTTGTINQTVWDQCNDGLVIIKFYANDTAGNIGNKSVTVNKDATAPLIIINSPNNGELFGNLPPNFNVEITAPDLNSTWYTLDNGITNITFITNGTINQTAWNAQLNGTITLIFYANDTLGNVGFSSIIIRKDVLAPTITIILPVNYSEIGNNSPDFQLSIIECNLNATWYSLYNGTHWSGNYTFIGLSGTINQTLWGALPEGSYIIRFYAKDTMGNLGYRDVNITKTFITPSDDDDDGDDGKEKEFDIIEFLASPIGLGIMGGVAAACVIIIIVVSKKGGQNANEKKRETIEKIFNE